MQMGEKMESLQVPAGYTVSAGLYSVPVWVQDLSGWLQFFAVVCAVLVGASTFYLNMLKIREKSRRLGSNEE